MFFADRWSYGLQAIVALGLLAACGDKESTTARQEDASRELALYESMFVKHANNPEPEARIAFLSGFSFLPPQGENWIEGPRKPEPDPNNYGLAHRLSFSKLLPQNDERGPHTVLANIFTMRVTRQNKELDPKEFIRFRMRVAMASDKVVKDSKVVSQKAELDDTLGYQCFRYDAVFENLGVVGFRGVPFKIDNHVMECIAPSRNFVVRMQYGQMTPPDVESIDITQEGEGFLKSLQFTSQ
ncbi:hypothetical protein ACFQZO_10200 [Bradyrhizobium sp. GCM10027634]|uniref:hypothetical protein n=1 Tax=unclassified Bradyrhizobium TaxID=2631580 RepID=UPI00263BDDAF|nr:hypothetical protein [Bradyrhizobium sp. WYCCWR 12677]MDN5001255.1 hypothetical protein [Bradyrhizobium sp. WYCCWR 12677]